MYLPGILGAPPPPPSKLKQASPNGTKTTNLMTSMDQIIRAPSPVETSVSIKLQGGGMFDHPLLGLEVSFTFFAGVVQEPFKIDIESVLDIVKYRNSFACSELFRSGYF